MGLDKDTANNLLIETQAHDRFIRDAFIREGTSHAHKSADVRRCK